MPIITIAQSAQASGMKPEGQVAFPLSEPAVKTSGIEITVPGAGASRSGIWECGVGSFKRQLESAEVMHILSGECTFTEDEQEPLQIGAGDTVFFGAGTHGVWNVTAPLRKVYVILAG